jgi:hypothetical protein
LPDTHGRGKVINSIDAPEGTPYHLGISHIPDDQFDL